MKKIIFGILVFGMVSAQAAQINCKIVDGNFDNSSLKTGTVSIESNSSDITLVNAEALNINILGHTKRFNKTALTVGDTSKLDFELDSNKTVKATLLTNKTPGQIMKRGKFNALIVISGVDISLSENDVALSSYKSLVYNLSCNI